MAELIDLTALDPAHVAEVERICDRFESARRSGGRPRIEDELPALPGPARGALLGDLIELDLAYRRRAGEPREAEPLLREVLDVLARMPDRGARSEAGALANANLAELLAARGDKPEGERCYRAALDIAQAIWPVDHPTVRAIRERLDAVQGAGPNDPSPP
jgi:hypothetical protein